MQFLYSDNGGGIVSSLMGSWIFWIVIVLVIVLIVVLILKSDKSIQKQLGVDKFFGNITASSPEHESLLSDLDYHTEYNDDGPIPNLEKYLDSDLSEELINKSKLLGVPGVIKDAKSVYTVPQSKELVYKVADESQNEVNFKIELHNLTKAASEASTSSGVINELKLFNQDRKCIAIMTFDPSSIKVKSISPYFDDVTLDLENTVRLLVFKQVSNKLLLDNKEVARFDIYDKVRYFYINSSLIKEIQYFVI